MEFKLEPLVVLPVSDVGRAKAFYQALGFRLDADYTDGDDFRIVHFTPPGSDCSITFGEGITSDAPGSLKGLYLIVADIEKARAELIDRGVEVSAVFHDAVRLLFHGHQAGEAVLAAESGDRTAALRTARASYGSYATFDDPDGNTWVLQELSR